jgi:hypothetical protein
MRLTDGFSGGLESFGATMRRVPDQSIAARSGKEARQHGMIAAAHAFFPGRGFAATRPVDPRLAAACSTT